MRIRLLVLVAVTLTSVGTMAQLSDPREKFSISATVIGAPNSDYTWESTSGNTVGDGRMKGDVSVRLRSTVQLLRTKSLTVSLSPFYNFSNQRQETMWREGQSGFSLPSTHHHYGAVLGVNYQFQIGGKSLMLLGMGTGNFSQYGYESAQGMLGGLYTLKRDRETYLAVGAIYLLGTAVAWPLYPFVVYNRKFNARWSLSFMGVNNHLYYHASPAFKYGLGMELETSKFYFRPSVKGLPEKAQVSQLAERVGVFADWQAAKGMSFNIGLGASIPFYGRLQESGYRDSYMNLKGKVKPFVSLKAKISVFRNNK